MEANINPSRKTALITGASAGIGMSFAWELGTKRGYNVILIARRVDRLAELKDRIEDYWRLAASAAAPGVCMLPGDLSLHEERLRMLAMVNTLTLSQPVDLLVNNAGFGHVSLFTETNLERQIEMITVNCIAPLHLMHHFLPRMFAHQEGTIINIASVCSFMPMPFMATYGATKAFLHSLGVAVAAELRTQPKIKILTVCPGPTESEFHFVAGLSKKLSYLHAMSAEEVVVKALDAAESTSWVNIPGLINRLLVSISRMFHPSLSAKIVEFVLRRNSSRV